MPIGRQVVNYSWKRWAPHATVDGAWTGDLDAHPFWAGVEALDLVALPEVLSANETGGIFFPNPARQRITSRASRFDKSQIREAIHFTKFAIY